MSDHSKNKQVVVVGNGWSALASVGFLISSGIKVKWITGSATHILPPLSSLEWGPGVQIFHELARIFEIPCGEIQTGNCLREFRNKAFREPAWVKAPTPSDRLQVRNEVLWGPECKIAGTIEARWELLTPAEIIEAIRNKILKGKYPQLERIEGIPVTAMHCDGPDECMVELGSGEKIHCNQVIFADRWGLLSGIEGLPKGLPMMRKREPVGAIQAIFLHDLNLEGGVYQSFYSTLHRAGQNEVERHVWGHFSSQGNRSIWTLCLTPEELEDNQEIARNLRRLKSTLDRMFQGSDLIPQGKTDFGSTLKDEQVRFEEEAFFADPEILEEPFILPKLPAIQFITDGYGPSRAFQVVGTMLGIQPVQPSDQEQATSLL